MKDYRKGERLRASDVRRLGEVSKDMRDRFTVDGPATLTVAGGGPHLQIQQPPGFWALVVSCDSIDGACTWLEMVPLTGGAFQPKLNGRTGAPGSNPAYEATREIVQPPFYAWLLPGWGDTNGQEYLFERCCGVGHSSGTGTGTGTGTGSGGPVTSPCCPFYAIPANLCLTITGATGTYAVFNGSYTLTYSSTAEALPNGGWVSATFVVDGSAYQWVVWCFPGEGLGSAWVLFLEGGPTASLEWGVTGYDINWTCNPLVIGPLAASGPPGAGTWGVVEGACGGGGGISRSSLGTANSGGVAVGSLTLTNVTVANNALLVVVVSTLGSNPSIMGTWGSLPLTLAQDMNLGGASPIEGEIAILYTATGLSGGTHDITIDVSTGSPATSVVTIQAIEVTGLASNVADQNSRQNGASSTPDTSVTPTTTVADEYVQAAFILLDPGGVWGWGVPFNSGGQDISETVSAHSISITEGYDVLSTTNTPDAILTAITPANWCGVIVTFK